LKSNNQQTSKPKFPESSESNDTYFQDNQINE
jgi:hypothetical protein